MEDNGGRGSIKEKAIRFLLLGRLRKPASGLEPANTE